MPSNSRDMSAELREIKDLLVEAITGTANLVETVHSTINTLGGVLGKPGRTKGMTGLVNKNITGIIDPETGFIRGIVGKVPTD